MSSGLSDEWLDATVELLGDGRAGATVRVHGHSMLPTLRPGQHLTVEFLDFASTRWKIGELVLFRQPGQLVVHRLIGWTRDAAGNRRMRTRGDGTIVMDPPLDPAQVVGRVTAWSDGRYWHRLEGPVARLYASALAAHDFFWAAAGALAARLGGRPGSRLREALGWIDRRLLAVVHALFHRLAHRRSGRVELPGTPP